MKLYRVKLTGIHGTTSTNYNESFVVADNPAEAYEIVREYLNKEDIGFSRERCLDTVKLVAEQCSYPECRTMLFIKEKTND